MSTDFHWERYAGERIEWVRTPDHDAFWACVGQPLGAAERAGSAAEYRVADAAALPFPDNSVDRLWLNARHCA